MVLLSKTMTILVIPLFICYYLLIIMQSTITLKLSLKQTEFSEIMSDGKPHRRGESNQSESVLTYVNLDDTDEQSKMSFHKWASLQSNADNSKANDAAKHFPETMVFEKTTIDERLRLVKEYVAQTLVENGVFGTDTQLHLAPLSQLLSPSITIQQVLGSKVVRQESVDNFHVQCFFSGHVVGQEKTSTIALNVCGGLRGLIRLMNMTYYVEHARNMSFSQVSPASLSTPRPPLNLHQQQIPTGSSSTCGLTEEDSFKRNRTNSFAVTRRADALSQKTTSHNSAVIRSVPVNVEGMRRKRSSGMLRKHRVETMVVMDSAMYDYHGSDLQHYVLTLMFIVQNIYKDPTLRNYVNIVVVKFIVFQAKQDMPFMVSSNAAETLREFCTWQHAQNDRDPNSTMHHDTAILITREDICRAPGKCDTLGLAELGTICDPHRSCSIVEDNGLSSAFTIAHELGHVFNLPHDDDGSKCNGPTGKGGKMYHLMAPTLDTNSHPWDWSECSARLMTQFIEDGLAECLRNPANVETWNQLVMNYEHPGWLYGADRQCEFIFGPGYQLCPYTNYPRCQRLWCIDKSQIPNSGCRTQHMPWADGTICGPSKYCQRGQCVVKEENLRQPVNGGWSSWRSYGPCSRTCGGGVKNKTRICSNPSPAYGGGYCLGRRIMYKSCNSQPCPAGSRDFRSEQCASYNGRHSQYSLSSHTRWVPKYAGISSKDVCKLYCRASPYIAYHKLARKVTDGTKCHPFSDDICVNGQCVNGGCDNRLGSKKKRDQCGVCDGKNRTCRTFTGFFNNAIYGYNFVTTIPSGATGLDIRQYATDQYRLEDDSYLAMQDSDRKFLLNGEFVVRSDRWMFKVKGGLMEYSGSDCQIERINSSYLLGEPINLYVLSVGELKPPNVTYFYTMSSGDTVTFKWSSIGAWRKCSHTCRGKRRRRIVCIRADDNLVVSKKRCKNIRKPQYIEETCNMDCIVEWRVFLKEECPIRCGQGMQRQLVQCVKQTGYSPAEIIRGKECRIYLGVKPDEFVPCTGLCLPSFWSYTTWSECTVSCGGGNQNRQAQCVDTDGRVLADDECDVSKRVVTATCNSQYCPRWIAGSWRKCSPACGKGVTTRDVTCRLIGSLLSDSACDPIARPITIRRCYVTACIFKKTGSRDLTGDDEQNERFWKHGSWTECSATCGNGTRLRSVKCAMRSGISVDDTFCSHLSKPSTVQTCSIRRCGDWRYSDWSDCTVSCGGGVRTRFVNCIVNDNTLDDSFCNTLTMPDKEIQCVTKTCRLPDNGGLTTNVISSNSIGGVSRWIATNWSACSVTCGHGYQFRNVKCRNDFGISYSCQLAVKPDEYKYCDVKTCPHWITQDWSKCYSKSCEDVGVQYRDVYCRTDLSEILHESKCNYSTRPVQARRCNTSCSTAYRYRWTTGTWSQCSATCGRGQQQREIHCADHVNRSVIGDRCVETEPRTIRRCFNGRCPVWKKGPWNECSVTCGKGVKTRGVTCRRREQTFSSNLCPSDSKPIEFRSCHQQQCPPFVWNYDIWSECSKTCGFGLKYRSVTCQNIQNNTVFSHLCDDHTKPNSHRRCAEYPCPFTWNAGSWCPCSVTCGQGQQTRMVRCQTVTKENWMLEELHDGCISDERPPSIRNCNHGSCHGNFFWILGNWSECSAKCGNGRQTRDVICSDRLRQRVSDSNCHRRDRPSLHQPCYTKPCYARSCKELKEFSRIRSDGDYKILVRSRLVKIYCMNMRKSNPFEYITLPAGETQNFAEIYHEKLARHGTCPYNKTRPATCLLCRARKYRKAGVTAYTKIRINLDTLQITESDATFSKVRRGKYIPFGTAGDCYSSANCPQGQFSINLSWTDFKVSINTTWVVRGHQATQRIWRLRDGEIIRGLCGGYCGTCSPSEPLGIQLEVKG